MAMWLVSTRRSAPATGILLRRFNARVRALTKAITLAHQHEDVAGFDEAGLALVDDCPAANEVADGLRHTPCQDRRRRTFRRRIERRGPVFLFRQRLRRDHVPEIDRTRMADAAGAVHDGFGDSRRALGHFPAR